MRFVKLGLLSIVIIFVVLFLISLLFPSHIRISRAINLSANRQAVFSLLKDEPRWHPAYTDSTTAKTVRHFSKSNPVQTDSSFQYMLSVSGRRPVANGWQLYGAQDADSLTLQWYMDFQLGILPWEKFSSLLYESTYGRMMERGLANFKKQLAVPAP